MEEKYARPTCHTWAPWSGHCTQSDCAVADFSKSSLFNCGTAEICQQQRTIFLLLLHFYVSPIQMLGAQKVSVMAAVDHL